MSASHELNALQSIRFDGYKSFSENGPFTIQVNKNLVLIIGRNNCGKSSIIDVIEAFMLLRRRVELSSGVQGLCASFILDQDTVAHGFPKGAHHSLIGDMESFGKQFIGEKFTVDCTGKSYKAAEKQEDFSLSYNGRAKVARDSWDTISRVIENRMVDVRFRRVNADRDVVPEFESDLEAVSYNGNGATNLVRKYINNGSLDESIVEERILDELNTIMQQDACFTNIRIQQVKSDGDEKYKWEIFLEEDNHRFALSKSGSGLKTILLLLINLYLIPMTNEYVDKEIVFAFEEIENNLHPALQRRVFQYLYNYAVGHNAKIFITSHSHVAINTFFDKEHASICHITKDKNKSSIQMVSGGKDAASILDDLDVKASDLFQANGIIWVEGPSDRVYILQWLKAFTDCELIEGLHFQFMYYGGRLLSHYELEDDSEKTEGLINILTTNRNAAIIIDSDKRSLRARINQTKRRVRDEFNRQGYYCWITKGKEIENYVAAEAVNQTYGCNLKQIEQYEVFPEYIVKYDKSFSAHKVDAARKMCEHITEENSESILDLQDSIITLYNEIKKWNNLE